MGEELPPEAKQNHRTSFRAHAPTTEMKTTQDQKKSTRAGPQTTNPVESKSKGGYPEVWNISHLIYTSQISERGDSFRDEYRVTPSECCTFWNLGFECIPRSCDKWHVCCFESCRTSFHTEHRAIQHSPQPDCAPHAERLLGMNLLFPQALNLDDRSTVADTLEACSKYGIKPPSLNADRFEELLRKTDIDEDLQASLVRGWREGFNLGSKLIIENHFAKGQNAEEKKRRSSEPV